MSDSRQTLNMLRPFYRGLPIIIGVMIAGVMAAKKYLKYATPMYESVAKIKLADAAIGVAHANLYRNFDVFATSQKIAAEVEMLKSNVVVTRALGKIDINVTEYRIGDVHKTELYKDRPFLFDYRIYDDHVYDSTFKLVITGDSLVELRNPRGMMVKGKFNHLVKLPGVDFFFRRNDSLLREKPRIPINDRYEFTINSKEKLVAEISEKLDAMFLDKESPILRIAYKTPVAQKSADIVNAISEAYIQDYILEKYSSADTTVSFLDKEVNRYSKQLVNAEDALEKYRTQRNVISIKQETETNLKKISELKNHLSGLQMDLVAIDSLDAYVERGQDNFAELAPNFQTFNDLLSTEMIKKIKQLQSDKHDLLLKYTPESEKVKIVDTKLADIFSYLRESVKNTRTNLQIKYDDLAESVRQAEAEFATFPNKDRNMTILERNFNLNDQNYRFLREKKTDAEIARAASLSFHRIISPAEVASKPVSPNPGLLKVLAGFLGFVGGTFLIYLVHGIKNRVNNDYNIQKNSDTPIFAKLPYFRKPAQSTPVFDKVAIDLHVKKQLENGSIVAISSYGYREGKAATAIGLAKAVHGLGKKTLLLDTSATREAGNLRGADYLSLPAINPNWRQPKLLKATIDDLKQQYEVIIIKNLAISAHSESLLTMSLATINLLILDSRRTNLKRVEETDLLKEKTGLSNIQFVLNRDGYTPNVLGQAFGYIKKTPILIPLYLRKIKSIVNRVRDRFRQ